LIKLFRESGNQISVNLPYDAFTKLNTDDYHETVMTKASFATCGEHLDSLTPDQRNDYDKMMKLTRIFESKYSGFWHDQADFETWDEGYVDDATVRKSMIKNHPFKFASKKLLNNKKFIKEALWFSNADVVCWAWKHVIPWWVQRKTWYMAHVETKCYNMGDKMAQVGVFSNRKKILEVMSIDNRAIYLVHKHNPDMLSDIDLWKGVSQLGLKLPQREQCLQMMPLELRKKNELADVVTNLTAK